MFGFDDLPAIDPKTADTTKCFYCGALPLGVGPRAWITYRCGTKLSTPGYRLSQSEKCKEDQ